MKHHQRGVALFGFIGGQAEAGLYASGSGAGSFVSGGGGLGTPGAGVFFIGTFGSASRLAGQGIAIGAAVEFGLALGVEFLFTEDFEFAGISVAVGVGVGLPIDLTIDRTTTTLF